MDRQPEAATTKGPAERFTGDVYVAPIVQATEAGFTVASVHFTPGAHTAWHSHAAGQMLHCTEGRGLVVTPDRVIPLRPGETVWTPPNQRHWHGALPDHFMTHLAMSAAVDPPSGQEPVTWQEHVSDEDYVAATSSLTVAADTGRPEPDEGS